MTEQLLHVLNRARHQLRQPPAGTSRIDGMSMAVVGAEMSENDPFAYYEQNDRGDWTCLRHAIKIVRRTCEFLPFRKMIRFIRQLEATAQIRVTKTTGTHAHARQHTTNARTHDNGDRLCGENGHLSILLLLLTPSDSLSSRWWCHKRGGNHDTLRKPVRAHTRLCAQRDSKRNS